jgi:folate-binding Fe-S cluster repair protein YgfZ
MIEDTPPLLNGVATLSHLGVIRVEGDDAARFLQGQLTQDFALLGLSEARLSAFCSAKGRMQASFIGFKRGPTDILLVCSRDILAATLKRLSMFVLRAKARLTDASHEFGLAGLAGIALESIAGRDHSTLEKIDFNDGNLIWLPPAGTEPRALWIAPAGVPFPPGPAMAQERWLWGDVASGVATVTAPIRRGREFQERLLSGSGSYRPQPVSRHFETKGVPGPWGGTHARRAGDFHDH